VKATTERNVSTQQPINRLVWGAANRSHQSLYNLIQQHCSSAQTSTLWLLHTYIGRRLRWTKITCKASDMAENLQLYWVVRFFCRRSLCDIALNVILWTSADI